MFHLTDRHSSQSSPHLLKKLFYQDQAFRFHFSHKHRTQEKINFTKIRLWDFISVQVSGINEQTKTNPLNSGLDTHFSDQNSIYVCQHTFQTQCIPAMPASDITVKVGLLGFFERQELKLHLPPHIWNINCILTWLACHRRTKVRLAAFIFIDTNSSQSSAVNTMFHLITCMDTEQKWMTYDPAISFPLHEMWIPDHTLRYVGYDYIKMSDQKVFKDSGAYRIENTPIY